MAETRPGYHQVKVGAFKPRMVWVKDGTPDPVVTIHGGSVGDTLKQTVGNLKNLQAMKGAASSDAKGLQDDLDKAGHAIHNVGRKLSGQETPEEKKLRLEAEQREKEAQAQQAATDLKNRAMSQQVTRSQTSGQNAANAASALEEANNRKRANLASALAEQNAAFNKANKKKSALGLRAGLNSLGDAADQQQRSGGWKIY